MHLTLLSPVLRVSCQAPTVPVACPPVWEVRAGHSVPGQRQHGLLQHRRADLRTGAVNTPASPGSNVSFMYNIFSINRKTRRRSSLVTRRWTTWWSSPYKCWGYTSWSWRRSKSFAKISATDTSPVWRWVTDRRPAGTESLCEQGKMQSENLLRSECGDYESDEGGGRVQQYYAAHQYNVSHSGQLSSQCLSVAGTILETDFIPRPHTLSLSFYPFIVSPYKFLPPLGNQEKLQEMNWNTSSEASKATTGKVNFHIHFEFISIFQYIMIWVIRAFIQVREKFPIFAQSGKMPTFSFHEIHKKIISAKQTRWTSTSPEKSEEWICSTQPVIWLSSESNKVLLELKESHSISNIILRPAVFV